MEIEERSEREIAEERDREARRLFVEGLRALADWYEAHPGVLVPKYGHTINVSAEAEEFRASARSGGGWAKMFTDQWVVLRRTFGPIILDVFTPRRAVCTARVVGTRLVPEQPAVPAREEPVVEWDCAPVLGLLDDEAPEGKE